MSPNLKRVLTHAWQVIVGISVIVGIIAARAEVLQFGRDHMTGILITIGAILVLGHLALLVVIWKMSAKALSESQKGTVLASTSAFIVCRLASRIDADSLNSDLVVLINTMEALPEDDPRRRVIENLLKNIDE